MLLSAVGALQVSFRRVIVVARLQFDPNYTTAEAGNKPMGVLRRFKSTIVTELV